SNRLRLRGAILDPTRRESRAHIFERHQMVVGFRFTHVVPNGETTRAYDGEAEILEALGELRNPTRKKGSH
ncbi:MAG: hypothetical protein Q9187_003785, partial [Circinaria calcarea]